MKDRNPTTTSSPAGTSGRGSLGSRCLRLLGPTAAIVMALGGSAALAGPPTADGSASKCPPSFCVDTAAAMWFFEPANVPLSQRASPRRNLSLVSRFETPRLFAATDQASNFSQTGTNDYVDAFQGSGSSGNVYNFSQWPYVGQFYYYNHAAMAVPPTGWTNAAHRNGTPILGVLTGDCKGCGEAINAFYSDPVKAAKQLALIANTYGFDGWLFDVESGVDLDNAIAVMKAFRSMKGPGEDDLIALYYEASVYDLSDRNPDARRAFDAAGYFQADYGTGAPADTYKYVSGKLPPANNPFKTSYSRYVYSYQETTPCTSSSSQISNGAGCLNTQDLFSGFNGLIAIRKPSGGYYQSPGLYAVGWERWGGPDPTAAYDRSQVQQAHRDLFIGYGAVQSGSSCKPNVPVPNSVAAYVDAAGVALSSPFVTRFNTGEGDFFNVQGVKEAAKEPWNGIGLQDVQPTWLCAQGAGQKAEITYSSSYDGGSALSISGTGVVSLYSTRMAPPSSPLAIVRYQGPLAPLAMVKDGSGTWKRAREIDTSTAGGWTTSRQVFPSLSGHITEIGVSTATANTTVGELAIMDASDYQPDSPPPTQSLPAPTSGDLTWTNPAGIWYSNVYGCTAPGASPQLLGRTFQPAFDPKFTIQPNPSAFPRYTVQPVSLAGIGAATVACR